MILSFLAAVVSADFTFLQNQTGLTAGNLPTHIGRPEKEGYVSVSKEFAGRIPRTLHALIEAGRTALAKYRQNMRQILDPLDT